MARYLELVARHVRWDQLKNNTAYPVRKDILVSTTDPRSSNSAAMYLAIASYVANGDMVVQGASAERKVLPTMSGLFVDQGYTDNTTEGPFGDYLSLGMGKAPLVCAYEAQFVDAAVRGLLKPGMVLMYPSPTVQSKHTLIPLDDKGDQVGRLLSNDPGLQSLAARHGFRTADSSQFADVVTSRHVPVATNLIDVVDTPSAPSSTCSPGSPRRTSDRRRNRGQPQRGLRGRRRRDHMTQPGDLFLTPPEPVAAVPAEKAETLIPLDDATRDSLAQRAKTYVDELAVLDPRTPEFMSKIGQVATLGDGEMRASSSAANRMLNRSVAALAGAKGDQADAQKRVATGLVELRRTVEDLDPKDVGRLTGRKLLSKLPFGKSLRDFVSRYQSANVNINSSPCAPRDTSRWTPSAATTTNWSRASTGPRPRPSPRCASPSPSRPPCRTRSSSSSR
jgi:hypothetical protein